MVRIWAFGLASMDGWFDTRPWIAVVRCSERTAAGAFGLANTATAAVLALDGLPTKSGPSLPLLLDEPTRGITVVVDVGAPVFADLSTSEPMDWRDPAGRTRSAGRAGRVGTVCGCAVQSPRRRCTPWFCLPLEPATGSGRLCGLIAAQMRATAGGARRTPLTEAAQRILSVWLGGGTSRAVILVVVSTIDVLLLLAARRARPRSRALSVAGGSSKRAHYRVPSCEGHDARVLAWKPGTTSSRRSIRQASGRIVDCPRGDLWHTHGVRRSRSGVTRHVAGHS